MTQARTLNQKQIDQCLSEAANAKPADRTRERVMLLLSIKAGLRAKEIALLSWDRIDWESRVLLLRQTKGDKPRRLPISNDLFEALEALKADAGDKAAGSRPVLPSRLARVGDFMRPNTVTRFFDHFHRRRMGWEGFSSHSGRRTFVWSNPLSPRLGDPRRVEFRVYVNEGRPTSVELFVRLRKFDYTPDEARIVTFPWPGE